MSDAMIAAVLALVGTLVGSLGGIMAANRLVVWRIEQLEKKVDRHNSIMERTCILERDIARLQKDHERLQGD